MYFNIIMLNEFKKLANIIFINNQGCKKIMIFVKKLDQIYLI